MKRIVEEAKAVQRAIALDCTCFRCFTHHFAETFFWSIASHTHTQNRSKSSNIYPIPYPTLFHRGCKTHRPGDTLEAFVCVALAWHGLCLTLRLREASLVPPKSGAPPHPADFWSIQLLLRRMSWESWETMLDITWYQSNIIQLTVFKISKALHHIATRSSKRTGLQNWTELAGSIVLQSLPRFEKGSAEANDHHCQFIMCPASNLFGRLARICQDVGCPICAGFVSCYFHCWAKPRWEVPAFFSWPSSCFPWCWQVLATTLLMFHHVSCFLPSSLLTALNSIELYFPEWFNAWHQG